MQRDKARRVELEEDASVAARTMLRNEKLVDCRPAQCGQQGHTHVTSEVGGRAAKGEGQGQGRGCCGGRECWGDRGEAAAMQWVRDDGDREWHLAHCLRCDLALVKQVLDAVRRVEVNPAHHGTHP